MALSVRNCIRFTTVTVLLAVLVGAPAIAAGGNSRQAKRFIKQEFVSGLTPKARKILIGWETNTNRLADQLEEKTSTYAALLYISSLSNVVHGLPANQSTPFFSDFYARFSNRYALLTGLPANPATYPAEAGIVSGDIEDYINMADLDGAMADRVRQLGAELIQSLSQVEDPDLSLDDVKQILTDLVHAIEQKIADAKARAQLILTEMSSLNSQLTTAQNQLTDALAQIPPDEAQVAALQGQISNLQGQLNVLQVEAQTINEVDIPFYEDFSLPNVSGMLSDVTATLADIQDLIDRIGEIEDIFGNFMDIYNRVQDIIRTYRNLQELRDRINQIRNLISNFQKIKDRLFENFDKIKAILQNPGAYVGDLKQKVETYIAMFRALANGDLTAVADVDVGKYIVCKFLGMLSVGALDCSDSAARSPQAAALGTPIGNIDLGDIFKDIFKGGIKLPWETTRTKLLKVKRKSVRAMRKALSESMRSDLGGMSALELQVQLAAEVRSLDAQIAAVNWVH